MTRSNLTLVVPKPCYSGTSRWVLLFTHWGRVTHICVSKLTIIGSDNGLSPGRRQAVIWTNAGILLIGPLGTKSNQILITIHTFSFRKIHFKMSSAKWRPCCVGELICPWTKWQPFRKLAMAQVMVWRRTSHYLNQCWPSLLTHIYGTREGWINDALSLCFARSSAAMI